MTVSRADRHNSVMMEDSSGCDGPLIGGLFDLAQPFPFPGKQLVQARGRQIGDADQNIGEPGLRVNVVEACGSDECQHDRGTVSYAGTWVMTE